MTYTDADFQAYLDRTRAASEKRKRAKAVRQMPLPPWFNKVPKGFCRWCGKPADPGRIYWHADCLSDYFLARNPAGRVDVLKKTACRCAGCAQPIRRWVGHASCEAGEYLRPWEKAVADGPFTRVAPEDDPWQADHVVPLWSLPESLTWKQRLAYFLLGNLQALCEPCHKAKTARECAERADLRRAARDALVLSPNQCTIVVEGLRRAGWTAG